MLLCKGIYMACCLTLLTAAVVALESPSTAAADVNNISIGSRSSGPVSFAPTVPPLSSLPREVLARIANSSQEFALDMFQRVSLHSTMAQKDFIISPFAIWSLLLPLMEGAEGNTLIELRRVMHLELESLNSIRDAFSLVQKYLNWNTSTIQVASLQAFFTDRNQPANSEYQNKLEREYGANIIPTDFQNSVSAAASINEEVRKATRGLIEEAVYPEDVQGANLFLLSSLFFKGQWQYPFNATHTVREPFYNEENQPIGNVDMMMQFGNFNFTAMNDLQAHVLELPYGTQGRLSMLIVLPKRGVNLYSVSRNLRKIGIAPIFAKLDADAVGYEDEEVEVHMPKFSSNSDYNMQGILIDMGLKDIFLESHANLNKISPNLYLKTVVHSTKIIVDEEGTTAASVAGAVLANKSTPPKFYLNRPFMYLIIEKTTNAILFCGHLMNPH